MTMNRRYPSIGPTVLVFAAAGGRVEAQSQGSPCVSATNIYTMKVDLLAGELGYYSFEECGDVTNPTIGMEVGQTYTFIQTDRSNYYHPVGFAYFPDGAHDDVDELEPGVVPPGSTSTCGTGMTCPAPMYFRNGEYLGTYSNIPEVLAATTGEDNFGLDDYEPLFFHPLPDWAGNGPFEVQLRFDDETFTGDIFYFCHIHQFMTGRIKLLKSGVPINGFDTPTIDYAYDAPGEFDKQCGTFGLDPFQLPNPQCLSKFVCDVPRAKAELLNYSKCTDAMNCHMMVGMTTAASSGSKIALFNHQMIPHHQNAVNMAKSLLKTGKVVCDDLTVESDGCALEQILREIINNQNFQIQTMRGVNEELNLPEEDDCEVMVSPGSDSSTAPSAVEASDPSTSPSLALPTPLPGTATSSPTAFESPDPTAAPVPRTPFPTTSAGSSLSLLWTSIFMMFIVFVV